MTLPLTPRLLQAAYEFLCQTPPFSRWKMPTGDDLRFRVTRSINTRGAAVGMEEINISSLNIGRTDSLVMTMAHEMIHIYNVSKGYTRSEHGAEFKRCARLVCKHHGFDLKMF